MRLVQYRATSGSRLGVVFGSGIVDVSLAASNAGKGIAPFHSMLTLLEAGAEAFGFVRTLGAKNDVIPFEQGQLDFPVAARKIVVIGLNYRIMRRRPGSQSPTHRCVLRNSPPVFRARSIRSAYPPSTHRWTSKASWAL